MGGLADGDDVLEGVFGVGVALHRGPWFADVRATVRPTIGAARSRATSVAATLRVGRMF
jgi:hypothetical protein